MFGILLGLAILMFLAFKGWSILWAAPIAAIVVALSAGVDLLGAYTESYMNGFVGFTRNWFPVFMLGAIFGKLMEFTGMAKSIAIKLSSLIGKERAILAVIVSCAVLTYGGISLFVVVFAIYPLALNLFREANISRKIMPATIAVGAFTFTMTALPGTPQIQNLIPMDHFNTTAMAAPIMGIVAAIIIAVLAYQYLIYRQKQLTAAGEVFVEPAEKQDSGENENLPNPYLSLIPLITVIVTFNAFNFHIITALVLAILIILVMNTSKHKEFIKSINAGATGSLIAIMNTSAAVGFGAVVQSVPAFDDLAYMLFNIPGTPLISCAIAVTALAGATGSASGGMGIALAALGEQYYQMAIQTGISPEAFHRVSSLASGGLDTLPHNGAVLTVFAITGMTHKESYKDIFMAAVIVPVIAIAVVIALASFGIY
ncbi:MAG: GntP family permease [Defluviitaleaceae bacterium]|nr:GntP family permease [Defluviitaleaceae bacterium]